MSTVELSAIEVQNNQISRPIDLPIYELASKHPDLPINEHLPGQERHIFGTAASGVFGAVEPTRAHQLEGVVSIATAFEPYSNNETSDRLAEIRRITKGRGITSAKVASIGQTAEESIKENGAFRKILDDLEITNDPLYQVFRAIEKHEPPLSEEQYSRLVIDSLTMFHRDRINNAMRDARVAIKKSTSD